jgi:hypothetical protein
VFRCHLFYYSKFATEALPRQKLPSISPSSVALYRSELPYLYASMQSTSWSVQTWSDISTSLISNTFKHFRVSYPLIPFLNVTVYTEFIFGLVNHGTFHPWIHCWILEFRDYISGGATLSSIPS